MGKKKNTEQGSEFVTNFIERGALAFQQLVTAVSLGTICKICSSGPEN